MSTPGPATSIRHPRLTLFVVFVVGYLLIDVGGTLIVNPIRNAFEQRHSAYIRSPISHHDLLPRFSTSRTRYGAYLYPMATNSLGFRDESPREVAPQSAKPRLLFIGDSFTEGLGVSYADSFAGRVDQALRPRGIEVLNAGVFSHAPIVYRRKLRHLFEDVRLHVDELVVFLDLPDIVDEVEYYVDEKNVLRIDHAKQAALEPQPAVLGFLELHTSVTFFLVAETRNLLRGQSGRVADLVQNPRASWTVDDEVFRKFGEEGLRRAAADMDEIVALAHAHGVGKITLVVYPWPTQIYKHDLDSRQVTYWRSWCAAHQVSFLNLFPAFVGVGDPDTIIDRYFLPKDIHWNSAGHALVADEFLKFYQQR